MKYFNMIIIVITFCLSYNAFAQIAPKKIGERSGSITTITHNMNDLKQAIMQEIGDVDIITEVRIDISPNGNIWLVAKGSYGTSSRNFKAGMYENNGNLYMIRGNDATSYKCKGDPCESCDFVNDLNTGRPSDCSCGRPIGGTCKFTNTPSPSPGAYSMSFVERYLVQ